MMADDTLTQSDTDVLFRAEKVPASANSFHCPDEGGRIEVPLMSRDAREHFSLSFTSIAWSKRKEFRERLAA